MRTIAEIKNSMTSAFMEDAEMQTLYGFAPGASFNDIFSKVSFESILFDIVAFALWTVENLLNISILNQNTAIKAQKIHSFDWYSDIAKAFQFGYNLPTGSTEYDNTGIDPTLVEASQVVKFASATKTPGGIRIKIAGITADELSPITGPQLTAFNAYIERVKAAGDNLTIINDPADMLRLDLTIYVNPLLLNLAGERIDGSSLAPVPDAIDEYIKGMDFNGRFIPTFLIDALQAVEGVELPVLNSVETKYALLPWTPVPGAGVIPNSGYVRIYDPAIELTINYEVWPG